MNQKLIMLLLAIIMGLASACSNSDSHRQAERNQNEADQNTEMNDLEPAEGDYTGIMHMIDSSLDFKFNLSLTRSYKNIPPTQPADPTLPINIPILSGSLSFPVIDQLDATTGDYDQYAELIGPMGGDHAILFDYGDYDPKSHILILPYSVSGYSRGNFGNIQGKLINGVFTGKWFAKPEKRNKGIAGTFTCTQSQENP